MSAETINERDGVMLPATLSLESVVKGGAWPATVSDSPFLQGITASVVEVLDFDQAEYAVVAFATDAEVQSLNVRFLGNDKPTNVLSFPAHQSATTHPGTSHTPEQDDGITGHPAFLGDIILAAETVHFEAIELGITVDHHVAHLIVHGLLHLLGYDHVEKEAAEDMEALEIEILAALDIPNPYTEELVDAG